MTTALTQTHAGQRLDIVDAADRHQAAIQAIYAHYVLHERCSFEEAAPSVDEMRSRRADVQQRGLPYVVACIDDTVVGYAYASIYRPRSAYRHTVENSVYVQHGRHGRGIGKALLHTVIARCEAAGYRQMLAVVGDSANIGSIRLHESLGFERVGTLRDVGFKFGQWIDTVLMQRALR
jgi:phosphinothricin acetyltransferase